MPSPSDFTGYLVKGGYMPRSDREGLGGVWTYRGLASALAAAGYAVGVYPLPGTVWSDGFPVDRVQQRYLDAAETALEVSITTATTAPVTFGSTLEQTFYEQEWLPVEKPLEVHKLFRTSHGGGSGTYALTATSLRDIHGWKNELDPALKKDRKYKALDSSGIPSGTTTTISDVPALEFISFLELGVEAWVDFIPIWTKESRYFGSVAPSTGDIGAKETPSGSGYASGYEWVKTRDNAKRIGTSSKWQRVEQWTGAIKVLLDRDAFYLS